MIGLSASHQSQKACNSCRGRRIQNVHVVRELLQVSLLLGQLLLELLELLLLALADRIVLAGALALLEGVPVQLAASVSFCFFSRSLCSLVSSARMTERVAGERRSW